MSNNKKLWLDFKQIKDAIGMEALLEHYGLLKKMNRKGEQLTGFCPLPDHSGKGKKSPSFSVNTDKNAWKCFSCDKGGNIFDFVMRMENLTEIREAAKLISSWFDNVGVVEKPREDSEAQAAPAPDEPAETTAATAGSEKEEAAEANPPLTFTLKNLDTKHEYLLKTRRLKPETIEHFGLGYCRKGLMKDRIVIPIHNQQGELVAYAGRALTPEDEADGKYKFPPNFHKTLEVFNLHRARTEGNGAHLILVEGFFAVLWLWQAGFKNAAALMGSSLSDEQEDLLVSALSPQGRVTLLFDGDPAGRDCTQTVLERLSRELFVKVVWLNDNEQPDSLTPEELQSLLG